MFPFDRLNLKWERERSLATIHQSFSSKTNTYNTIGLWWQIKYRYDKYSYFDIEKDVVDGKKRVEQPKSGLTEFWWTSTFCVAPAVLLLVKED